MRLPRDLTGAELVRNLGKLGYTPTRQTGSHVRLTCESPAQHDVTVPLLDRCVLAPWLPFWQPLPKLTV